MFIDLLKDIAAQEGINLALAPQKKIVIVRANQAAQEIYNSYDLYDSLREQVVDINVGENQVALPWYMEHVRGLRYYDNRLAINSEDIKNRYNQGVGTEVWYLAFRRKETSVLQRELANESILTFSLPKKESSDITITIAGPTDNSSQITEDITLEAGSLIASCVNNFKSPLSSISKNTVSQYDITIKDIDGNIVGVIPNCLTKCYYNIYQTLDTLNPGLPQTYSAVEVLYKRKFVPMQNDTDEFICGQRYEKAIFWKYFEHRASTIEEAQALQTKCNEILYQIEADTKSGTRERINFVPSPYLNLQYWQYYNGYGSWSSRSRR